MHIYIRTGSNENTGITFTDGTQWEEAGSGTGFTHTPARENSPSTRYTPKPKYPSLLHAVPFGDRGLAALVLAQEELCSLDPGTEIDSLTWVRSNNSVFHDLKTLFLLDGVNCEDLIPQAEEALSRYLVEANPGNEITITQGDLRRVKLESGQPLDAGILSPRKSQAFTITSEDGESSKTYEIPEFLRQSVYQLPDEQRTLILYALTLEKLRALPPHELVNAIHYPAKSIGYTRTPEKGIIPGLSENPTDAGTLREFLDSLLAAYIGRSEESVSHHVQQWRVEATQES